MFKFAHVVVALALGLAATVAPAPRQHHVALPAAHAWSASDVQVAVAETQEIPAEVAAQRQAEAEAAAKAAAEQAAKAAEDQRQAAAAAYAAAHPVVTQVQSAQPAAASTNYGSGTVQQIIHDAFAPYGQAAIDWGERVAKCESGYNPRAYNPAGPYYGLFQFLMSTFKATPYGNQDIYDPVANAKAAAWKYSQGGQSAWGCN